MCARADVVKSAATTSVPTGAVHAELGAIPEALLLHVGQPTKLTGMMLNRVATKEAAVEQARALDAALASVSELYGSARE